MARHDQGAFVTLDNVSLGIQNLFNRDYYPLYSQLLRSSNNTSHLPAPGTTLTVSYSHQW